MSFVYIPDRGGIGLDWAAILSISVLRSQINGQGLVLNCCYHVVGYFQWGNIFVSNVKCNRRMYS